MSTEELNYMYLGIVSFAVFARLLWQLSKRAWVSGNDPVRALDWFALVLYVASISLCSVFMEAACILN